METKFLFPNALKKIGWILFIPALIAGIFYMASEFEWNFLEARVFALFNDELIKGSKFAVMIDNNLTDEIIGILLLVGAVLVAFSKEKEEDEFIMKLRLESLLWATYVNVIFILFCLVFVYGFVFFNAMLLNMYSLLILFIIRFNIIMIRTKKRVA
ncbi:MAG: hypothetical protein KDC85_04785 [Saprospiraceae bacterium]|nr:hypothetical protein [Saprospiraceae bacterium]MCB9325086.1 hypothetical protein [Lewinellaceae bacterium]